MVRRSFGIFVGIWILFPMCVALADEDPSTQQEPTYLAVTSQNPNIPVDELEVMVKPLTRSELKAEAEAWFVLLRDKARQIANARLGVGQATDEASNQGSPDPAPENDSASELLADINELHDERARFSDRLEVVLDSLERKGGDVEEYRNYASAVGGLELDTGDLGAAWAEVVGWFESKEGGRRLARNFLQFVLILVVTYLISRIIAVLVNWTLDRKIKLSQLAERLISRWIKNAVMLIGFAIALTALEVDITPVLAAIGATGLVVGLALQGTLSNFASGLMILINRPFDVGHVVTAGGVTGTVDEMNLVSTRFRTFDNQTIHVPNNEIWNNVITNITANQTRRVDLEFGIGYDDDFEYAENLIREVVDAHELVLDDPEPIVVTHELADSSVNLVCRPWAKTSDWWQVRTDIVRDVKRRFDQAGITFPYPQRDIHVYNTDSDTSCA